MCLPIGMNRILDHRIYDHRTGAYTGYRAADLSSHPTLRTKNAPLLWANKRICFFSQIWISIVFLFLISIQMCQPPLKFCYEFESAVPKSKVFFCFQECMYTIEELFYFSGYEYWREKTGKPGVGPGSQEVGPGKAYIKATDLGSNQLFKIHCMKYMPPKSSRKATTVYKLTPPPESR